MKLPDHRLPKPIGELKGKEAVTWCEKQLAAISGFNTQLPDTQFKPYFLARQHDSLEMIEEAVCHIREGGLDNTGRRWLQLAEGCSWEMRLLMGIFNHLKNRHILITRTDLWWWEHGDDPLVEELTDQRINMHNSNIGSILKELSESPTPVPDHIVKNILRG